MLTIFYSCIKTDKSIPDAPCTDFCTIIQERFITGNNEGIARKRKNSINPSSTSIISIPSGQTTAVTFTY